MMASDNSERGKPASTDPTRINTYTDDDGEEGMVTLDMGNTVSVMPPDHEIESMKASRPKYRKWLVSLVVGLAVLAVVMIVVLISVSTSTTKENASSASNTNEVEGTTTTIADDSGNSNGGAIVTTEISPPVTTTTPTGSDATVTVAPVTAATLPPSTRQGCLSDRFDNENMAANNRLIPGQYICSMDVIRQFQFGLTPSADLIYKDTHTNKTLMLYKNPYKKGKLPEGLPQDRRLDFYFSLTTNGTFVMHMLNNTDPNSEWTTLWEAKPVYKIELTEKCLPSHDCPYLHVHQGGMLVLNWIGFTINTGNALAVGSNDNWQTQNFLKVYKFDLV